jgi:hypothetical protein
MAFVEYTQKSIRSGGEIKAALTRQRSIRFSSGASEKFFKNTEYCILLFDQETRRIAVKPVAKKIGHAYRVLRLGNSKTQAEISIASFMKYFSIPLPEKSRYFSCVWDEQLGAVVLEPEKPVTQ